ncbi:hypothetical protein C4Q28_01235 [Pseudomonas sp. SWI6]|nr:hypothetical protein C4Q28_01235 [Pseudomonas sp. SWI6]AVD87801.1 hypothetical protein C4Q26_11820 [Pseudomonas sp. SWI44]MPS97576.1 hypothetical protein [Pseudomonas sp.]
MHGAILLFLDAKADRSSAKAAPSEQQVHTVLNAGKPMLQGRTQVNIAPRRKLPVQYAETDRLLNRRRWRDRRDDGASANVPYQDGKHQEGNRRVCRYPPRFSATSP